MKLRSLSLVATGATLALIPLLFAAQAQTQKPAAPPAAKITGKSVMTAEDLKWVPMPGLEGAQQCAVFGDPTKEAHRIFYKWAAGTKTPTHTHTNGDRVVIISGAMSLVVDGAPAKKLTAGAYFSMAGGTKHSATVEGTEPCVFYLEREGPFDIIAAADAAGNKQ